MAKNVNVRVVPKNPNTTTTGNKAEYTPLDAISGVTDKRGVIYTFNASAESPLSKHSIKYPREAQLVPEDFPVQNGTTTINGAGVAIISAVLFNELRAIKKPTPNQLKATELVEKAYLLLNRQDDPSGSPLPGGMTDYGKRNFTENIP